MSNKKMLTDEQLDNMLKNYCTRTRESAFDVKQKRGRISFYKKKSFRVCVVSFSLVLILSLGFFATHISNLYGHGSINNSSGEINENVLSENSNEPKGFIVRAFAAEIENNEPVIVRDEKTSDSYRFDISKSVESIQFKEDGTVLTGDDFDYEGEIIDYQMFSLAFEPFYFSVEGDNIISYDISCEKGNLITYIPDLKTQMLEGDDSISQDDYFKKGKSISVEYNSENPDYMLAMWYPGEYLDEKILEDTGIDTSTELNYDECKIVSEYKETHLKNSDGYTEYLGDNISITVNYADGTSEQAKIEISIDYKSYDYIKKGTGAGNYVTCYK